jgi:phage protein D
MYVLWGDEGAEINDIGKLSSLDFEDSIEEDDVAELRFVKCPADVNDRPEVQNGQKILVSFGRGTSLPDPIPMVIEEAEPDYGNGVSLIIRAHDMGTKFKGVKRHRVFDASLSLQDVIGQISVDWNMFNSVEQYDGDFDRVQRKESDYSYLSRLAKKSGFRFWIACETLYFRKDIESAVLYKFIYRNGVLFKRFKPLTSRQAQSAAQVKAIAEGFDPKTRQVLKGESTTENSERTRIARGQLILNPEDGSYEIVMSDKIITPVSDQVSVDRAAEGVREEAVKSQQGAEFYCPGFHDLRAGIFIQIEGVAEKDAGIWRVKKAHHKIGSSGYECSPLTLDRENIGLHEGENISAVPPTNVNTQEANAGEDEIVNADSGESFVR